MLLEPAPVVAEIVAGARGTGVALASELMLLGPVLL
jgi:hypothetical protein